MLMGNIHGAHGQYPWAPHSPDNDLLTVESSYSVKCKNEFVPGHKEIQMHAQHMHWPGGPGGNTQGSHRLPALPKSCPATEDDCLSGETVWGVCECVRVCVCQKIISAATL